MNIYEHMAYYVAKKLSLSPNRILKDWSVPELIVTYGHYANEESYRNYLEYMAYDSETRRKIGKKPEPYRVYFYTVDELDEGGE